MSEQKESSWGLKLLAVSLAVTAWIVLTVEKPETLSDKAVEVSVRYDNFPGLIVIDPIETVRVGVRGPESKIGMVNSNVVDVSVELPNPTKGIFEVPLTHENVLLPDKDLEVISIEPQSFTLELDLEARQLLQVQAKLEGEPAAGAVVQHAEVIPPSVLVRGPESRIRAIESLFTTPVKLTGHAISFQEQAAVLPPDPLVTVIQPAVVTVRVHMEIPGTATEPDADAEGD